MYERYFLFTKPTNNAIKREEKKKGGGRRGLGALNSLVKWKSPNELFSIVEEGLKKRGEKQSIEPQNIWIIQRRG